MEKPMVKLVDYNPDWVSQFEGERKRIIDAVGDQILGIEHIGSTAIKGLKAKPILDIMAGVKDLSGVSTLVSPLSEIGFEYAPKPELTDRRFFRKGPWGRGTCHLHVCEMDSKEWIEKLLFRDYLRTHLCKAEEYAKLKNEVANKYKFDRQAYTQQKGPFIKDVIDKARGD